MIKQFNTIFILFILSFSLDAISHAGLQSSGDVFSGYPLLEKRVGLLTELAKDAPQLEYFSVNYVNEKKDLASQCKNISPITAKKTIKQLLERVAGSISDDPFMNDFSNSIDKELEQWIGVSTYKMCFGSESRDYSRSDFAYFKKESSDRWIEFEVGFEN